MIAIQKAVGIVGSQEKLANALGLKNYQNVQYWLRNGVPVKYCPAIERLTCGAVRCEDLRPDVDWAYLREASDAT